MAHELDESRILHSRGHRLHPHGVKFVQHNPGAGIDGTDLTPDMVEEYDPLSDLDISQPIFNSAYPTYRAQTQDDVEERDTEPQKILYTRTICLRRRGLR